MIKNAAAVYVRVSTEDQTVDNQLLALSRFLHERGISTVAVYQEAESAWKAGHQAELARLRSDARKRGRPFDYVAVWALDRLSRQGPLESLLLIKSLRDTGVKVLSYQEQWLDSFAAAGFDEVLIALLGWIAQAESARRSERTKAGMARKAAAGWKPGRPPGSTDKKKRKRRKTL